MKKLVLLGLLVLGTGIGLMYYGHSEDERYDAAKAKHEEVRAAVEARNNFLSRVNQARTRTELLKLESELDGFPKEFKEAVGSRLNLKIIAVTFEEADELFERARKLQTTLVLPPEPPPPPMPDPNNPYHTPPPPEPPLPEIHPAAQALADKAWPLYEEMKKRIDKIGDIKGDDKFNFNLHYTKGEVYYRYLQFFGTQETAAELFRQTVNEFKLALRHKPGDVDTVVNIELLIKQNPQGGGQGPGQQRQRMLNQSAGLGRTKGN